MDISRSPIHVLLNDCAGSYESGATREIIERELRDAGREYRIIGLHPGPELSREIPEAVTQAEAAGAVVVAAGGDGTLNAVAQAVFGRNMPFGILPQGTFNYFGREHGISQELPVALKQLLTGKVRPVQVGLVNGRVFSFWSTPASGCIRFFWKTGKRSRPIWAATVWWPCWRRSTRCS